MPSGFLGKALPRSGWRGVSLQFKSQSMERTIVLSLLVGMLTLASCKIIQVPPISSDETIVVRLDQATSIDLAFAPFGNLSRVYRREVAEVVQGKEVDFAACREQPPESDFEATALKRISEETLDSNWLVYDFKRVQFPRNLIDIALQDNKIYYLLGDGELKVNAIAADYSRITDVATHKTSESNVAKGNLVLLPTISTGLFVNHNQAALFSLAGDSFSLVQKYETRLNFESAVALEGKYFAAAYGHEGVRIFSVNAADKTLKVEYELNNETSGLAGIDIRDLAYDRTRKILFVVDYASGLLSLQLSFPSAGSLSAKLTSSAKKQKQCTLVYYDTFADELYLNCHELMKFRISGWPIIDEKVLPRQEIAIREIASTSKAVVLVGRDVFEMLVADRRVAIYEDKLLDKLIITDQNFISANEHSILIGKYSVTPPSLRCQTRNASQLGSHRLALKMTADCSQEYFTSSSFQPGPLNADDKCVYTVYKQMTIWQPAAINTRPFLVITICLMLLGLGILVWWGLSYISLRRLRNYFDNYQNLEEEGRGSAREGKAAAAVGQSGTSEKLEGEKAQKAEKAEKVEKVEVELQGGELHYDIQ